MGSETNKLYARVVRDDPGGTEIHVENRHVLRDGPLRVECWFSEEDGAYIAQLTDDEPDGRPFTATNTGIGDTREKAIAHLAMSEYVLALAVATPTPTADGEAQLRETLAEALDYAPSSQLAYLAIAAGAGQTLDLNKIVLALRARPALPADVQAVVERVRGHLVRLDDGDYTDMPDVVQDVSALLAHLTRQEG